MNAPACPKHDTGGGPCCCPIEPQAEAMPDSIKYGGVVWRRDPDRDTPTYRTTRNHVDMRVVQYAPDDDYAPGRWCGQIHFDDLPGIERPNVLQLNGGAIADTCEDAMCYCINAFDEWLDDMQNMLLIFKPDDQYAKGFRAGQEDIKAKVAEVVL